MVLNEKLRDIKIGITSTVASKWMVTRKIGEGAFGMVFECAQITNPRAKLALKVEPTGLNHAQESLKMETYVMRKMMSVRATHCAMLHAAGTVKNYNYVVMTLTGQSLSDIRKQLTDEKFSLNTLIVMGIQCTDALWELHSAGFVHRDIKPSNFTVGREEPDRIYLIDYGICREILYTEDQQTHLKTPRRNCQFRGTTRYCSLNAHKRKELGRHDDLLSMMYMLVEGYTGALPWKHKDRILTERLKQDLEEEVMAASPKPFARIFQYLKELSYFSTPNYKQVRGEFVLMAKTHELKPPFKLDWDELVVAPFDKKQRLVPNTSSTKVAKSLTEEQLTGMPDITMLYEMQDEFPVEGTCSDTDRTIPSVQEPRAPVRPAKEERTQSDEQKSMQKSIVVVQKTAGSFTASPHEARSKIKKLLESSVTPAKQEKKKGESPKPKVESRAKAETPLKTPSPHLPSPVTPVASPSPATAGKQKKTSCKEPALQLVEVPVTPLKTTEISKRRRERSEKRKKRREERASMKHKKGARTPKDAAKKTSESGKKGVEKKKKKEGTDDASQVSVEPESKTKRAVGDKSESRGGGGSTEKVSDAVSKGDQGTKQKGGRGFSLFFTNLKRKADDKLSGRSQSVVEADKKDVNAIPKQQQPAAGSAPGKSKAKKGVKMKE